MAQQILKAQLIIELNTKAASGSYQTGSTT